MGIRHNPFDKFMNDFERMMFGNYLPYHTEDFLYVDPNRKFFPYKEKTELISPYKYPALDVKDENDEIKVTIDLPGIDKENIKIRLVTPRTLEMSCEKREKYEDKKENYYIQERSYGYIKRMISLPSDVTEVDMKSEFKNGVLSLEFKKISIAQKEYLKLE